MNIGSHHQLFFARSAYLASTINKTAEPFLWKVTQQMHLDHLRKRARIVVIGPPVDRGLKLLERYDLWFVE